VSTIKQVLAVLKFIIIIIDWGCVETQLRRKIEPKGDEMEVAKIT
jgi:hypothetical protein